MSDKTRAAYLGVVGNSASLDVGTGPGTVAAGDDPRFGAGGTATTPIVVNTVSQDATLPLGPLGASGTGARSTGIVVESSFAGGEDDGLSGSFDSTGRIDLYSYQRADVKSYGENIRHFLMRDNAKSMDAWYAARENGAMTQGYDTNGDPDPDARWVPVAWAGAHWGANSGGDPHGHYSIEVPDTTGAVQTRLEVPFTDQELPAGSRAFGVDVANIRTNLADFTVRATGGQVLRIGAGNTNNKDLLFSISSDRATSGRRWAVRANTDAEAFGSNAGTSFQMVPYDDSGNALPVALHIARNTGNVGVGTTSPGGAARLTAVWSTSGQHGYYAKPSAAPGSGAAYAHTAAAAATERTVQANVTGDATSRMVIYADGKLELGDGTNARDTTLYRSAADVLATDDSMIVATRMTVGSATLNARKFYVEDTAGTNQTVLIKATVLGTASQALLALESPDATKRIFDYRLTADAVSRIRMDSSLGTGGGTITLGNGTSADTNLYRSAADVLKTDDSFHIGATLQHLGASLGFYNTTATTKQTVAGSRGGNAALASLITALATIGLVTDSTTA